MRYASSHYQSKDLLEYVHQVRYNIHAINQALEYAESRPDKDVIIEIPSSDTYEICHVNLELLLTIAKENKNVLYDFSRLQDLREMSLAAEDFERAFCLFHEPVVSWNMAKILAKLNAKGFTLGDPLVYEMDKVSEFKQIYPHLEIHIRPALEINPYVREYVSNEVDNFWLLPQHVSLYEAKGIDVLELTDNNVEREKTLVNIYAVQNGYNLPLSLLILGMDCQIIGDWVNPRWVERRMNCGRQCVYSDRCHQCFLQDNLFMAQKRKYDREHADD